jgi:hypothetical protein
MFRLILLCLCCRRPDERDARSFATGVALFRHRPQHPGLEKFAEAVILFLQYQIAKAGRRRKKTQAEEPS